MTVRRYSPFADELGEIPLEATVVNGTATPTAIVLAATVPAPTASGTSLATPAAIALVVTTPTPTASGNSNTSPSAIALAATVPAPTATGGGSGDGFAAPAAIELAVATSPPSGTGDATTTPSTVALSAVTSAPTATGGSGASATPSTVTLNATTPAPTASGNVNTSPSAVTLTVTVPAPTDSGNANTTPAVIARTVVTPAPTVTGQRNANATPSAIVLSITTPTPSASGSHVFATTIALRVTVPKPFVSGARPPDSYAPVGRVRLFDRTGSTLVANLGSAFDIEWQDVDNGPGIGRFKVALSDLDAALIRLGQVVYCDLYDRLNVYSWIVEQYPQSRIQGEEELGQVMEVSGRGAACVMGTALCYPYGGIDAVPVRSVRSFSFASPDYVEGAGWHSATAIAQQGDMTTYWTMFLPETTHKSSAPGAWPYLPIIPYWIWSQDDNTVTGKSYFRETWTTADPADVTIIATGDNYWTMYLDGVPILGDNENLSAWEEHRSMTMLLPAGDHTAAVVVDNVYVAGLDVAANPGGFLMAITLPNADPALAPDLMLLSDSGWNALAYPANEPGWTPGQIIIKLIQEAQARSLLTNVSWDFTGTTDSSGAAWQEIPELGVNVGSSLLTTLDQLVKDGWIEWAMTPSGWVLQMWNQGNRGSTTSVVFAEAVNIGEANYEPAHTIVNRLLVSYGKGLFIVNDAASQATWGIYEGFLTLDTPDMVEATRLANASIAEAADAELAVTMRIEPYLSSPDRPYVNFYVGDTVTGPSEVGTPRSYQVLGLTIQIDDMGDPVISAEMNRRVANPEENRALLLQTLGSAVTGTAPGSRTAVFENDGPYFRTRTPTTGDQITASPPTPGEVVFTVPGVVNTTGISPRWVTPYRFLIFQVVMAVTVAGSGDIVVTCLGSTFTLPAGQLAILINTELHRINADSFTVSLTDVGGGDAEGLTVTLRYRYYTGAI